MTGRDPSLSPAEHGGGGADLSGTTVSGASRLLMLVILGSVWGTQPSIIKALTVDGMPEAGTLGLAMVLIAAILAAILASRGKMLRFSASILLFVVLAGASQYAGPLLVAFLAAKHVDAGLLTLVMFTAPIFTVAAAAVAGVEPLDRFSIPGGLAGSVGLALLAIPEDALPSRDMLWWCLFAFSVPIMYAVGTVYISKAWPDGMDAMQLAYGGALLTGIALLPYWWQDLVMSGRLASATMQELMLLAALVASVIVEMTLYFYVIRHAGPVFASFGCFLSIAMGFIIGALVFGEDPSLWVWMSAASFLVALALILFRPHKVL